MGGPGLGLFLSPWLPSLGCTEEPRGFGCCLPAGARVEEFLYEKLDRKVPSRVTNGELLAQYMAEAASELGPTTPYGEPSPQPGSGVTVSCSRIFLHLSLPSFLALCL